jgi:serine/threonine protein phosphatase PrpC
MAISCTDVNKNAAQDDEKDDGKTAPNKIGNTVVMSRVCGMSLSVAQLGS